MTYNVFDGTLNPTLLYCTLPTRAFLFAYFVQLSNCFRLVYVLLSGRRLTSNTAATEIVNFSPLCPTIQSGPLRFRSFNYFSCSYISSPNKVITLIHM